MVKISFYTQATEFLVLSFRSENRPQMKNQYTCRYSYINFRSGPMENKKNEHFLSQKIPAIQHIVGLCSASSTHYHFQFGLKNLFTSVSTCISITSTIHCFSCSEIKVRPVLATHLYLEVTHTHTLNLKAAHNCV